MPVIATFQTLGALAPLATAVLVALAPACSRRERRTEAPPDVAPLRAALQKTADERLAPPSMAAAALRLTPAAGHFDEEVSRVVALARKLGGAAFAEEKGETTRVLAQIPAGSVAVFCKGVNAEASPPPIVKSGDESEWVEVTVVRSVP